MIIAIAAASGYGIYHETRPDRWVKYCSTDFLISLDWKDHGSARSELESRFFDKQFTRAQTVAYLTKQSGVYPFDIRSPRPVGSALHVSRPRSLMCIGNCGGSSGAEIVLGTTLSEALTIDGQVKHESEGHLWRSEVLKQWIPRLAPGTHTIGLTSTIEYNVRAPFNEPEFNGVFDLPHLPCIVKATIQTEISIRETDYENLIVSKYDEELEQAAYRGNWFGTLNAGWQLQLFLSQEEPAPPLAGRITLAVDGSDDRCTFTFAFPEELCQLHNNIPDCIALAEHNRAVFIPDAAIAFDLGYMEYFSGAIEWRDFRFEGKSPHLGAPEIVRPLDPVESAGTRAKVVALSDNTETR